MKKIFFALIIALSASACTHKTVVVKTPPPGQVKKSSAPGQVKKETGSKSAKSYAPGQKKKN